MLTGIKKALIMRISTTNMHNLAVKRHKIVKILSPNSAIRKIKSPRNLKILRMSSTAIREFRKIGHKS